MEEFRQEVQLLSDLVGYRGGIGAADEAVQLAFPEQHRVAQTFAKTSKELFGEIAQLQVRSSRESHST